MADGDDEIPVLVFCAVCGEIEDRNTAND